jgi:hypothetical protein
MEVTWSYIQGAWRKATLSISVSSSLSDEPRIPGSNLPQGTQGVLSAIQNAHGGDIVNTHA